MFWAQTTAKWFRSSPTILIVDPGGGGDFTTIAQATSNADGVQPTFIQVLPNRVGVGNEYLEIDIPLKDFTYLWFAPGAVLNSVGTAFIAQSDLTFVEFIGGKFTSASNMPFLDANGFNTPGVFMYNAWVEGFGPFASDAGAVVFIGCRRVRGAWGNQAATVQAATVLASIMSGNAGFSMACLVEGPTSLGTSAIYLHDHLQDTITVSKSNLVVQSSFETLAQGPTPVTAGSNADNANIIMCYVPTLTIVESSGAAFNTMSPRFCFVNTLNMPASSPKLPEIYGGWATIINNPTIANYIFNQQPLRHQSPDATIPVAIFRTAALAASSDRNSVWKDVLDVEVAAVTADGQFISQGNATPIRTLTVAGGVTATDDMVLLDTTIATFLATLPAIGAVPDGREYTIKWKAGAVAPTLDATGGVNIDFAALFAGFVQLGDVITVKSSVADSQWWIK